VHGLRALQRGDVRCEQTEPTNDLVYVQAPLKI
jgi:hypothetical protein